MTIYELVHSMWRNHPAHASTFSNCECGRHSRRGGEPCIMCISDKLVATGKISKVVVDHWINLILKLRTVESTLVAVVGKDAEL